MSLEALFYAQIGSIIAFIGTLFVLYRLLVGSKDATIETLKQQINFLEARVKALSESAPDVLLQRHEKRAVLLESELQAAEKEKQPLLTEIEELKRKLGDLTKEGEDSATRATLERQGQVLVTQVVTGRLNLAKQLEKALENDEFVLVYQPIVSLKTGRVNGAEALLRWKDPKSGIYIPPASFVPILEETGLMYEVGGWAMRDAVKACLKWRQAGLTSMRVAVNMSAAQLRSRGVIDQIGEAIGNDARAANALELEISESILMENVGFSTDILEAIRAKGPTIAIDDFGTGYSSLSYLSRMPLDKLKIDRSFLRHGATERTIVSTIIALAHQLSLRVVAEGVETEEQSELLRQQHCDEAQGYLFGKPERLDIFEQIYLSRAAPDRQ